MLEPELVKPTMTLLDELGTLLTRYGQDQGTDGKGAFRDMLTDLMHVAQNQGLDFNERLKAARRVFKQE